MAWWMDGEKRAAKSYAKQLPLWLIKNFGASEFYTPGQIRGGIKALGLDPRQMDLALAAFLPEAEYAILAADQPTALPYHEARERFLRWKPMATSTAAWAPLIGGSIDG
jgi:hypothetical protein